MLKCLIKSQKFLNEKWSIKFHENGVFHEIYPLKNKMKNGQGLIFSCMGKLSFILSQKNDKWHGQIISLWPDSLDYIAVFKNDKDHGVFFNGEKFSLHENGNLIFTTIMDNGDSLVKGSYKISKIPK